MFFAMAYVVAWIPWALGAFVGSHNGLEAYALLFNLVGLLGPTAAALFCILTSGRRALKTDFKDRIVNLRRIRPIYAIVAIAMPFIVVSLSIWLSLAFGQSTDQFELAGGANLLPMIILTMVLAPTMEEIGWHGYGVDSLRAYSGMLKATLLFGILWSIWHAPLVVVSGTYQHQLGGMANPLYLVNFFVSVIPAAIIANWLYYKNSRSVTGAVLVHAMLNAAAVLLNAGQVAKCIATLLYAIVAAAIIVGDRAMFGEGPRDFVHDQPSSS
jgi:membrane protease YdiL (CAAX protease family)